MPATSSSTRRFRVRPAVEADAESILRLIRGLAEFEKAPEEVINTAEQLREDGWGKTPRFIAFIAEVPDTEPTDPTGPTSASTSPVEWSAVAFALTYFAYSTWKGTCLYLEDIYVEPEWRSQGIGMALIQRCVDFAHEHRCQRVMWQALDWNTPAIDFYVSLGATIMKEWLSLRLTSDAIAAFRRRYSSGSSEANGDSQADGEQGSEKRPQQQQSVSSADMSTLA